tara:strand:+ start:375 stop:890 length:516 start_codon:yes stop_codon:yes gene_type:complete
MKVFLAIVFLMSGDGFSKYHSEPGGRGSGGLFGLNNFLSTVAEESGFKPLREILIQNPSEGLNYDIGKRCVAVGFVSVKLFEGSPEFEQENENVRAKTIQLIDTIVNDWAPSSGLEITVEEFMGEVGPIIELYKQEVRKSFEETGDPRSKLLLNDLDICKDVYWSLLSAPG